MEILLVEDDGAHADLTRRAFADVDPAHRVHVVRDGLEALAFLRREGPHAKAPRPDLILLDLDLPGKHGREVLAEVKQDQQLRSIPVVVLSSSEADADLAGAYDLHANCYLVKPMELGRFTSMVRSLDAFWLKTVTLPVFPVG